MKILAGVLLSGVLLFGQTGKLSPQEQEDLSKALAEAGSSPQEYLRAIEKHLAKYPNSPRKDELERAAARTAIEANDDGRIVLYGERVLAAKPDDLQILERVARSLLAADSKDTSERALRYARRYEQLVRAMQHDRPRDAEWQNQVDRGIGRALCYQARATGNLGQPDTALALAKGAFEQYPDAEAAREIAYWCERLGRLQDAARAMADAFTIQDDRSTDADRARDRGRMGDLYRKAKGSEAGLGDIVLEAYDRNLALVHGRELRLRASDPNMSVTDPMEFTLAGPGGGSLRMASLKGKVIVFDFWATWCGPCRIQHPLFEQVRSRFRENPNVVFLAVATDENHDVVKPFLDELKWPGQFWFEDGLSRALKISTIPTTLIIDGKGQVFSRMSGFVPDHYVEMLTDRIKEALAVH